MTSLPTMQAAVLDAYGTPFRVVAVARPTPRRAKSWSASPPAA